MSAAKRKNPLEDHVRRVIAHGLEAKNCDKTEFARHMGFAPSRVNELIQGPRKLRLDDLPKVAEFFNIPLFELVMANGKHEGCPLCHQPLKRKDSGKSRRR